MARLSDNTTYQEPLLPWTFGSEDRLFRRMVILFLVLFLLAGFIINQLTLPEPPQKKLVEVAPRLAKLIREKKKIPPPPKPKPKPEPKKKKEPEKKKPEKKKPEAKPKPKPKPVDRRAAARAKARQSGLIALQDDLADLRDTIDTADLGVTPQRNTGKKKVDEPLVGGAPNLIASKATAGSGGIQTSTLNRQVQSSGLTQRKTTAVSSKIESARKIAKKASGGGDGGRKKGRSATRSQEEIERVFQKNKGAIFRIYNRELRKDPALQGKIVVELTIAPDGTVTRARIISSELNHPRLEKRLLSKIRKFRFANKKVPPITVTYPIDFLPS